MVTPKAFSSRLNEIHLLLQFYLAINTGIRKVVRAQGNVNRLSEHVYNIDNSWMSPSGDHHLSEHDANIHPTASKPLVKHWSELKLDAPHKFKTKYLVFQREGFIFSIFITPENLHIASDYMNAYKAFLKYTMIEPDLKLFS